MPIHDDSTEPSPPDPDQSAETDVKPLAEDDSWAVDQENSDQTLAAPSYRSPSPGRDGGKARAELGFQPGETIDDFKIIELIGRGAFGGVYLARQQSLDRLVALKITANQGSEGRTLAQLEHDYIVRVFSETVDASGRFRLLCMQLVPGASLEDVLDRLRAICRSRVERGASTKPFDWGGRDYLMAIVPATQDADHSQAYDVFDPTALRDRELLGKLDNLQATAWIGARLAEAMDYAHQRKVLHRDIKPANVLVNRYGRPLLADFNIAERTMPDGGTSGAFGGTLAFMAPEHLDAFNPKRASQDIEVDERADQYSLAIVLHELLTGNPPFVMPKREKVGRATFVGQLADNRRAAPTPIGTGPAGARKTLERTLARALEPEKDNRFASGAEFAAALTGAAELRGAEREFPAARWLTRAMQNNALLWLVLLVVFPQAISSGVNIAYNTLEIGGQLTDAQNNLFWNRLVPAYNAIVYPLLLGIGGFLIGPTFRSWREVHSDRPVDPQRAAAARQRVLRLPIWLLLLVAAGWLPGGLVFPLVIDRLSGPISWGVYAHFVTSFTLSGLIAAAYSFAGLQYLVLRVIYPRMWVDATDFHQVARRELASSLWRIRFVPTLSYAIPVVAVLVLVAAALANAVVDQRDSVESSLLVVCGLLNLLGLVGVVVVGAGARRMARAVAEMTGRQV